MNKKGLSLVELIITIALISVVVIFMYRLLNNINSQIKNPTFAIKNQINRAEIINYIQDDLVNNVVSNIKSEGNTITIIFKDSKTSTLTWTANNLKYININGITRSWDMVNCFLDTLPKNYVATFSTSANYSKLDININVY